MRSVQGHAAAHGWRCHIIINQYECFAPSCRVASGLGGHTLSLLDWPKERMGKRRLSRVRFWFWFLILAISRHRCIVEMSTVWCCPSNSRTPIIFLATCVMAVSAGGGDGLWPVTGSDCFLASQPSSAQSSRAFGVLAPPIQQTLPSLFVCVRTCCTWIVRNSSALAIRVRRLCWQASLLSMGGTRRRRRRRRLLDCCCCCSEGAVSWQGRCCRRRHRRHGGMMMPSSSTARPRPF